MRMPPAPKSPVSKASGAELADLLMQLGRAVYAELPAGELTAAQWSALRYFSRANRFSRTVSGFAEFHATTRGTASQTLRSLVERGLLSRQRSDRDGRSVLFALTAKAKRWLGRDPVLALSRACDRLPAGQRHTLAGQIEVLQGWLIEARQSGDATGVCGRCGHLISDDGSFRCGLLAEELAPQELEQLCQRFTQAG